MIVQTYSGGFFDVSEPHNSEISIIDIAHSLSMQCRFNGHTRVFYSVAEHSVLVSRLMAGSTRDKMLGLLHDAAEAVLSDIPKPVKILFSNIEEAESRVLAAMIHLMELDLDGCNWDEVKKWDQFMVMYEALTVLNPCRKHKMVWTPWADRYPNQMDLIRKLLRGEQVESIFPGFGIQAWSPERAKEEFIARFNELRWQL